MGAIVINWNTVANWSLNFNTHLIIRVSPCTSKGRKGSPNAGSSRPAFLFLFFIMEISNFFCFLFFCVVALLWGSLFFILFCSRVTWCIMLTRIRGIVGRSPSCIVCKNDIYTFPWNIVKQNAGFIIAYLSRILLLTGLGDSPFRWRSAGANRRENLLRNFHSSPRSFWEEIA